MARYQPKHARPKKRRGNDATPLIHAISLVVAWPTSLYLVQHLTGKGQLLSHTPTLVVLMMALIIYALCEIVIALVISFTCVFVEAYDKRRAKNGNRRILDKL